MGSRGRDLISEARSVSPLAAEQSFHQMATQGSVSLRPGLPSHALRET